MEDKKEHKPDFIPLAVPQSPSTHKERDALLRKEVPKMERSRTWSTVGDTVGVKEIVGEENATYIERVLHEGGTVAELGAGKLKASVELADTYQNATIIAVEPFVTDEDLQQLPNNLTVVRNKVEDLDIEDIPDNSVDTCFSVFVFDYPADKLTFIQQAYRITKNGGKIVIHFNGNPTDPLITDIFTQFGYDKLIAQHERDVHGNVFVITKSDTPLDFGKYKYTTAKQGGAYLNTHYTFDK